MVILYVIKFDYVWINYLFFKGKKGVVLIMFLINLNGYVCFRFLL